MEVSFDSGNDEESAPKNGRQRSNDFLALVAFGGGPGVEPTLNKAGKYNMTADNTERRSQKAHAS